MSIRRFFALSMLLVCAATFAFLPASASATTCELSYASCTVTLEFTEFTGTPTVPCFIGHPVVQIVANVTCGSHSAGPFEDLKCGARSDAFEFSALGFTHTISLLQGYTWEDVLNGNCDALQYTRKH